MRHERFCEQWQGLTDRLDTSGWIAVGANIRVCHGPLTIQQLPLIFLWIQLLNPTEKYNHNHILQQVNKKLLLFLYRTEKAPVCQCYGSFPNNSTTQLSANDNAFPLAVLAHFHFFHPLLPTQPHSVSPPISHSYRSSFKAEWVIRFNTCHIMVLTIPCPFC